jgi:hypothetical protein
MRKRNETLEELKALHKLFHSSGFCSLNKDQYEAEVKRLRFKWITDYDR